MYIVSIERPGARDQQRHTFWNREKKSIDEIIAAASNCFMEKKINAFHLTRRKRHGSDWHAQRLQVALNAMTVLLELLVGPFCFRRFEVKEAWRRSHTV